jgi:hypothetical protein
VGRIAIGPFERPGGFVVLTNVAHDFSGEIVLGTEDASGDQVTLDFGEPDFDLIEPGRIGGRVVQGEVGIGLEEFADAFGFMSREVIDDGVNGFARRLGGDQLAQKCDKLGAGVARSRFAKDLAVLGFQRGVEREGAMAEVFETVTLCPTRGERQHRIEPVESLNGALFIHAENRGVDRGLEIEPDDSGDFGFEIRVVACHVMTQAVRLESGASPNPHHARLTCAERLGQSAGAPVRGTVGGFAMQGRVNDARGEFLAPGSRLSSAMAAEESRESFGGKAFAPQSHGIDAALLFCAEFAQGSTTGQSQDNSRPATVFTSRPSALGQFLQSSSLRWADHKSSYHGSHDTSTVSELNDSLH